MTEKEVSCVQNDCMCAYCFVQSCELQSAEIAVTSDGDPVTTTRDLVTFVEEEQPHVEEIAQHTTELAKNSDMSVGHLEKFLSRPVRIMNRPWLESDATGFVVKIHPWLS